MSTAHTATDDLAWSLQAQVLAWCDGRYFWAMRVRISTKRHRKVAA